MSTQKIVFVINPKAGIKKKINLEDFIESNFSKSIDYDLIIWKDKNDFESVKKEIINGNYTKVVACGGDGTVNNVASVVVNTSMVLGILPLGSGNGLARSNNIPMNLKKALEVIVTGTIIKIDTGTINSIPFFCTAGVGFDALIANKFAISTQRGFYTYFKTTIAEFFSYKSNSYTVLLNENEIKTKAFLITVANSGQWGNDVYIAPKAKLDDGFLNVSILKPFPMISIPLLAFRLFTRKINQSKYLKSYSGKKIEILFSGDLPVHYDGEPISVNEKIRIEILPLSMNIVC